MLCLQALKRASNDPLTPESRNPPPLHMPTFRTSTERDREPPSSKRAGLIWWVARRSRKLLPMIKPYGANLYGQAVILFTGHSIMFSASCQGDSVCHNPWIFEKNERLVGKCVSFCSILGLGVRQWVDETFFMHWGRGLGGETRNWGKNYPWE